MLQSSRTLTTIPAGLGFRQISRLRVGDQIKCTKLRPPAGLKCCRPKDVAGDILKAYTKNYLPRGVCGLVRTGVEFLEKRHI